MFKSFTFSLAFTPTEISDFGLNSLIYAARSSKFGSGVHKKKMERIFINEIKYKIFEPLDSTYIVVAVWKLLHSQYDVDNLILKYPLDAMQKYDIEGNELPRLKKDRGSQKPMLKSDNMTCITEVTTKALIVDDVSKTGLELTFIEI